jgi:hypothetical protein
LYDNVGLGVGLGVGEGVGLGVGEGVGLGVGEDVGLGVGEGVGLGVGEGVGLGVGEGVGLGVGESVGLGVGEGVGLGVGLGVGGCFKPKQCQLVKYFITLFSLHWADQKGSYGQHCKTYWALNKTSISVYFCTSRHGRVAGQLVVRQIPATYNKLSKQAIVNPIIPITTVM